MTIGKRMASNVSGASVGKRASVVGTRGFCWAGWKYSKASDRYNCSDGGSFVYTDCMYGAASEEVYLKIEEATLKALKSLRIRVVSWRELNGGSLEGNLFIFLSLLSNQLSSEFLPCGHGNGKHETKGQQQQFNVSG